RPPAPITEPKLAALPMLDPQPPVVHQTVAAPTRRDEVVQRGRSAPATPLHVVHHQAARTPTRPAAVAIAPEHRLAQASRHHGVARTPRTPRHGLCGSGSAGTRRGESHPRLAEPA